MSDHYDKLMNQLLKSWEKPTPEVLYHQLGRLRNDMPPWTELAKSSSTKWIGKVLALVEASDSIIELAALRACFESLSNPRNDYSRTATAVARHIDTVLAKLELRLPAGIQGSFIPAGGVFDGYQAVSKAIGAARKQVLIVDPYADNTLISDFVVLAPEGVTVRVLSDTATAKPSLKPAVERWIDQWKRRRPLEVRLAAARSLHDRLIVTDSSTAWVVGQSFKDLAKRAHSSLVRMDPESTALKISAYEAIWETALALV